MSQEEINNEVQIRLAVHDERFNSLLAKMDASFDYAFQKKYDDFGFCGFNLFVERQTRPQQGRNERD